MLPRSPAMWIVRVGGDDGELRPWHYIYAYSIESGLIMRDGYRYVHSIERSLIMRVRYVYSIESRLTKGNSNARPAREEVRTQPAKHAVIAPQGMVVFIGIQ